MICCFSLLVGATYAQKSAIKKSNYPYWTISKDVQRLQFKDTEFQPALVSTGNSQWVTSKRVIQQDARAARPSGKVAMTGTPAHVISKGVARMQYENRNN